LATGNCLRGLEFPAGGAPLASATEIDVLIGSNGFTDWRILTQPAGITTALAVPVSGVVQS
jgi:hypothetical protein